jgi:hypothetical protein
MTFFTVYNITAAIVASAVDTDPGFNGAPGSGSGFAIRILIQEDKNDTEK